MATPKAMRAPIVIDLIFASNAEAVDSVVFVPDVDSELVYAAESHITKGSDGGAVTLDVKKAASGTAVTSGTSMLRSTFSLKSDNNTPVIKELSNAGLALARSTRIVKAGEQVGVDFTGTTTAYVGGALTLVFQPLEKANW
jgi:hypothetical protein